MQPHVGTEDGEDEAEEKACDSGDVFHRNESFGGLQLLLVTWLEKSDEIKEQRFSVFAGGERECARVVGADGVTWFQSGAIGGDVAFDELKPRSSPGTDFVRGRFASAKAHAVDVSVLMDGSGAIAPIG